jgi:micrococcal nuclease
MGAGNGFREEMLKQPHSGQALQASSTEQAKVGLRVVKRFVERDTLVLENGERARLIAVGTPERKYSQKPAGYFSKGGTHFTRRLVQGKKVKLDFDQGNSHLSHKNKDGRTLADVVLENGTSLSPRVEG